MKKALFFDSADILEILRNDPNIGDAVVINAVSRYTSQKHSCADSKSGRFLNPCVIAYDIREPAQTNPAP